MSARETLPLPDGWRAGKIGDLFESWGGHTPSKSNASYWGTGVPWVSSRDVKEARLASSTHSVTRKAIAQTGLRICPPGSVLVVVRSGILAHTLPVAVTELPVTINQDLKAFYSDEPLMNEWLALFLRMSARQLLASSRRDGTTVQSVQYPLLKDALLPVPPLEQRRNVIDMLGRVSAKHAGAMLHLTAGGGAIDRVRRSVLAAACSGRLTADWRESHPEGSAQGLLREVARRRDSLIQPRFKSPSPIVSQDLQSLPTSWLWASVDALSLRVVDGVHKTPTYQEMGIPFVTVRSLTAGRELTLQGAKFISEEDHARFSVRANPERGDLLVSKDGTIGVTRAIRTDEPFSIFVSVALIKPVLKRMTDYLELALSSPVVQAQMIGVGSGLQHLVLRDLKADGIPVPPLEEQSEIVWRVSSLLDAADRVGDRLESAHRRLKRSQTALLAKAFRGELASSEVAD